MLLTRYKCRNDGTLQYVDPSGQRVGADQVGNPENVIINGGILPFSCNYCSGKGDSTHLVIVPRPGALVMSRTDLLHPTHENKPTGIEGSVIRDTAVNELNGGGSYAGFINGGVDVSEAEHFSPFERESESGDMSIGHVRPFDTSELADYDAPLTGTLQQAQLDSMFFTQERVIETADFENQMTIQEQNSSQELVNYNSGAVQQTPYTGNIGPFHIASSGGRVGDFGQLPTTTFQFNPLEPSFIPTHPSDSRAVATFPSFANATDAASKSQLRPIPTAPRSLRQIAHKSGKPCPESNAFCHYHYADWCHLPLNDCKNAHKAMRAAATNHNAWKGAPEGWNEIHANCVRRDNPQPCAMHQAIYRDHFGHDIGI